MISELNVIVMVCMCGIRDWNRKFSRPNAANILLNIYHFFFTTNLTIKFKIGTNKLILKHYHNLSWKILAGIQENKQNLNNMTLQLSLVCIDKLHFISKRKKQQMASALAASRPCEFVQFLKNNIINFGLKNNDCTRIKIKKLVTQSVQFLFNTREGSIARCENTTINKLHIILNID